MFHFSKKLTPTFALFCCALFSHAEDVCPEAVKITNSLSGSEHYYLFTSRPYVVISDEEKKLVVGNEHGPLFTVPINNVSNITMVLAKDIPDNIEAIRCFEPTTSSKNGKYIVDGKIIIFNKDKKYNTNGKLIK